jgi:alkylation response protein AidB-like acyl-CoA dehydrogenase
MELDLSPRQQDLLNRTSALARAKFAPRAHHYDQTATFPTEDFRDLFHAGLHAATVPTAYGGIGLGTSRGEVLTLWMMTKELAKADLSLARCWEGHNNSILLLDGMASPTQQVRWFDGIVQHGEIWVAWSGEPQSPSPGQAAPFGTRVEKVSDGYIVEGAKAFCTSATGAQWAILLVNTAGPGGARHATASPDTQLLLACNLSDPSVICDRSWWGPIGMRATVSYAVRFKRTFIPDDCLIGYPGQFLKEDWQTRFIPHYAASYLGAAEGAFDFALEFLTSQNKAGDPYVQHHVAQMAINLDTAYLWLQYVARLWETGKIDEAKTAGSRARHVIEHLAEEVVKRGIRACGARSLNHPSPLERIYRDLSFYVRHDNDDHLLAMIGKSVVGQPYDPSFFKP